MIPSYTFNEQLRRFEPHERKCCYCMPGHAQDPASAYYAPIYKVQRKTTIVVYRSVQYNKVLLGIPRCVSCHKIHHTKRILTVLYILIALVGFTTFGYYLAGIGGGFAAFAITALASAAGFPILESRLIERKGILTLRDGAYNNLILKNFLSTGWSLTPPAV